MSKERPRYGVGPADPGHFFGYHFENRAEAIRLANDIPGFMVYDFGTCRYLTAKERGQVEAEVRS